MENNENKKVSFTTIIVILILFCLLGYFCIKYYNETQLLREYNENLVDMIEHNGLEFSMEEYKVHDCYFCGAKVNVNPVNSSYYIECPACKARTNFYHNKLELIAFWNSAAIEDEDNGSEN